MVFVSKNGFTQSVIDGSVLGDLAPILWHIS